MKGDECPICGEIMEHDSDYLDGWCKLEESDDCPNGHYSYSYCTGVTVITIGNKQLFWNYNTSFADMQRIHHLADEMIKRYKARRINDQSIPSLSPS